jgi:aspartate aminotransferase-like enzyme
LFIPGPSEVRPEVLLALATPQIGHRSGDFQTLYADVVGKLKQMLHTEGEVVLYTSSSTGAWETAVRQGSLKKILCTSCGAFSERWYDCAKFNGVPADPLAVEWGLANHTEDIDKALSTGQYDAITYVLNETSTGVRNPIEEISALLKKKYPDVFLMVDAVSAMAGEDINVDELVIDFLLAGGQKCFSIPAGLAVVAASKRFMERAAKAPNPGYYFNIIQMKKYMDKNQTLTTPAIPQIYALKVVMDDIVAEGFENRWARHANMAKITQEWAQTHFKVFSEAPYWSKTLTCVTNTREINVADLNSKLGKHCAQLSNGYGKLKEKAFRIAHMGDTQVWEILGLLALIDHELGFKKWY